MTDLQASPRFNPFFMPHKQSDPMVQIPAREIPSWNVYSAIKKGVQNNFLINTWGGLGDQICAEPAIRFALREFKNQKISLSSSCPSLFSHLKFHEVFDTREQNPNWNDYLIFNTILPNGALMWEFCSHMITHCVDYPSICMWRSTMPNADKEIKLPDFSPSFSDRSWVKIDQLLSRKDNVVVIHAGKHWQSKTFPKSWWQEIVTEFRMEGFIVCLIGQKVDENVGYVEIDGSGCIDLRGKLSIPQFVYLLKNCKYLFSNDSSPIHAASAGDAFVGVVATCKHPDYILHWRHGEFGWNAKNFGLDGIWNHLDHSPSQEQQISVENIGDELLLACLPEPRDVAEYYANLRDKK